MKKKSTAESAPKLSEAPIENQKLEKRQKRQISAKKDNEALCKT